MNNEEEIMLLLEGAAYLHTNKAAIEHSKEDIGKIVGVVILGDLKKTCKEEELTALQVPFIYDKNLNSIERIEKGLENFKPSKVYDLAGSPTVTSEERNKFGKIIAPKGIIYEGLDFRFTPEKFDVPALRDFILHKTNTTTLGILGTGKRVGKTSVITSITRLLRKYRPVLITMGRGGPVKPRLISSEGYRLSSEDIIQLSKTEEHIASDNWQTSLSTGLPVIGCFRVGEAYRNGIAAFSNLWTGTTMAEEMKPELIIYQGSGVSRPPVRLHGEIVIIGADQDPDKFGKIERYSIIKGDMIIITKCEDHMDNEKYKKLKNFISSLASTHMVIETVFRPKPVICDDYKLKDKKVLFFTTSPSNSIEIQKKYLEEKYGCNVVNWSNNLADRGKLKEDITKFLLNENFDSVLTEFKAASLLVMEEMFKNNKKVIVFENELIPADYNELKNYLDEVIGLACARNC